MTLKQLFKNEEHRLNAFFGLGYLAMIFVLAGFVWLVDERFPTTISTFDFILLSLATFRLIRLFVYDKVSLFIREYFRDEKSGPKKTIGDLLGCPWCFGIWASTFLVFFYYVMPMAWFVILILAVSGVASFVQILANMFGWRAEHLKNQVQDN